MARSSVSGDVLLRSDRVGRELGQEWPPTKPTLQASSAGRAAIAVRFPSGLPMMVDGIQALLCGDLFAQPGADHPPLVESDILGPSEAMRAQMDYYAHGPNTLSVLQRLAALQPKILACMHGSAWRGDGAQLLTSLARALA
jgi:hypothetical protein